MASIVTLVVFFSDGNDPAANDSYSILTGFKDRGLKI
jgi:hypothetical protein